MHRKHCIVLTHNESVNPSFIGWDFPQLTFPEFDGIPCERRNYIFSSHQLVRGQYERYLELGYFHCRLIGKIDQSVGLQAYCPSGLLVARQTHFRLAIEIVDVKRFGIAPQRIRLYLGPNPSEASLMVVINLPGATRLFKFF